MSILDRFKKKKELDKRIVELKEQIEESKNESLKQNRFSSYNFSIVEETLNKVEQLNDYEKYEFFNNIVKNYERGNKLSIEDGEYLNSLMSDPNTTLAIHRTNVGPIDKIYGMPNNTIIDSIITEGLINNGHAMQGSYKENPSLSLTTSPLVSFGDLINFFSKYKNNNVIVILQFPKELVDDQLDMNNPDQIYNREGTIHYIKPEFIKGIVVKEDNQDKLYKVEDLLKVKNNTK